MGGASCTPEGRSSAQSFLRLEDMHGPHYVLPADGALAHPLATFGAGYHVTTFQQHAVDDGVHADATQVFIGRQLSFDTICGGRYEKPFFSYSASLAGSLNCTELCDVAQFDSCY